MYLLINYGNTDQRLLDLNLVYDYWSLVIAGSRNIQSKPVSYPNGREITRLWFLTEKELHVRDFWSTLTEKELYVRDFWSTLTVEELHVCDFWSTLKEEELHVHDFWFIPDLLLLVRAMQTCGLAWYMQLGNYIRFTFVCKNKIDLQDVWSYPWREL